MTRTVTPHAAMQHLTRGTEVALLDLREAGPFSEGHPLFAVPCPWSTLEVTVPALVPRRDVPVLLIDGGDGVADQAADTLGAMGYGDVACIAGGAPGWAAAGFTLFKGVHVPSKTLGELAEEVFHPKALAPDTFAEWRAGGREVLFLDTRPASEHRKLTVPGTTCLPNGELPHRLEMLPPGLPIVVTCAGRTRGIVGAVSLSLVAPDRAVYWLEDGTQGWRLAGHDLLHGAEPAALPPLDDRAARATRDRAAALMQAHDIPTCDAAGVRAWQGDAARTTYVFDVRAPEEAARDPVPGATPAPAVDLVQGTDRFVGVRCARVILCDDLGLRGALAAFWLRALGHEVAVARISDALRAALSPDAPPHDITALPRVAATDALADGKAQLIDVRSSSDFMAGHVEGATWSIRPRLADLPETTGRTLLIGDGTPRADLAGATLGALGRADVAVIDGGMEALVTAGASPRQGPEMDLKTACDITSFAHGRHDGNAEASRLYLAWEKGLVAQLSPAERAQFHI